MPEDFTKDCTPQEWNGWSTQGEIGSFLHVLTPAEANHLQKLAEKSRLKIPLLIGIDAIHGNGLVSGSTIYPSPIGMASTFAPDLIEQASRQTALEMRATGSHWAFTPNIEIACDARWGRVGETFRRRPVSGIPHGSSIHKRSANRQSYRTKYRISLQPNIWLQGE